MIIPGQPPPSLALAKACARFAAGDAAAALDVVRTAALTAKATFGSGSLPLARAYADMARLHCEMGKWKKAALEFRHASSGPLPSDVQGRKDRLAFMFGFATAVAELGKLDEAEKVLRQCVAFSQSLHGPQSRNAADAYEALAHLLRKRQKFADAVASLDEACAIALKLEDRSLARLLPLRAEWKCERGNSGNAFDCLAQVPDAIVSEVVGNTLQRVGSDGPGIRRVLADLLSSLDKKYGDGHSSSAQTLVAIVLHETKLGPAADAKVRAAAFRRAVWSFAVRRSPAGLLENVEVGFEAEGTIHLVPRLTRNPSEREVAELQAVLSEALDELYSRLAFDVAH